MLEVFIGILIAIVLIGFFWNRKVRRDNEAQERKRLAEERAEERRSSQTRSAARESERIFTEQPARVLSGHSRPAPRKPAPAHASPSGYGSSSSSTSNTPDTTSNMFLAQAAMAQSDNGQHSRGGNDCDSRGGQDSSPAYSAPSTVSDSGGGGGGGSCGSGD